MRCLHLKRRREGKEQRWQRRKKEKNIDEGGERLKGRGRYFFRMEKGGKKWEDLLLERGRGG